MKSAPDKQIEGNEEKLSDKFERPLYELYDMPYREVIDEIAKRYPYCIYFFLWRVYCSNDRLSFKFPYNITAKSWNKFQTKLSNINVGKKKYSLLKPVSYKKAYHSHFNIAKESNLDKDGPIIYESLETYGFWDLILQIPKEILSDPEKFNLYFVKNFKLFPLSSQGSAIPGESKSIVNGKKKPVKEDINNLKLKISTTKTKSSYPLTIKCGFCKKEHDYYVEKKYTKENEPKGYGFINREENNRKLRFKIDFHNWDFDVKIDNQDINQILDQDLVEDGNNTVMFLTFANSKRYLHNKSILKPKKARKTRITKKKIQLVQKSKPATIITQQPSKILNQKPEDTILGNRIINNRNIKISIKYKENLLLAQKKKEKREEREKKLKEEEKRLKNERYENNKKKKEKENQKRFKKIKRIYRKALIEEVIDCLEVGCKKLMRNKVKKRLYQKSSFIFSLYSQDDFVDYRLGFKRYRKAQLSKDLQKYNKFLKKVTENKNKPDPFEDSKEISEIQAEYIEDIHPIENYTSLGRYKNVIRYFLFLTLLLLFIFVLILGFIGINNLPLPPSSIARSFKDICIMVYLVCMGFIGRYLIPILYSISFEEIHEKN